MHSKKECMPVGCILATAMTTNFMSIVRGVSARRGSLSGQSLFGAGEGSYNDNGDPFPL